MEKTFSALLLCLASAGAGTCYAATPQEAEAFTRVAGFSLASPTLFAELARKLGKSQVKESGDAATGERSVCYRTAHGEAVVEFYEGEVDTGFTVRQPGAGDARCVTSGALTPANLNIAGITLGMSRAAYEQRVGKPNSATGARVSHEFHYVQTLTDAALNEMVERARRNGYKDINAESWRKWDVEISMDADFTGGKLTSFSVSRSAQN